MSKWDDACRQVKRRLGYDVLTLELLMMKAEGDKLQKQVNDMKEWAELNFIKPGRSKQVQRLFDILEADQ